MFTNRVVRWVGGSALIIAGAAVACQRPIKLGGIAADDVELVKAPVGEPALDQFRRQPLAPAHGEPHPHVDEPHRGGGGGEGKAENDADAGEHLVDLFLLEGVEEELVPAIDCERGREIGRADPEEFLPRVDRIAVPGGEAARGRDALHIGEQQASRRERDDSLDIAQAQILAAFRGVGPAIVQSKSFEPAMFAGLQDGIGLTRSRLLHVYRILLTGTLLLLVLAFGLVMRRRYGWAAGALAGAILLKQFAVVALPFVALMIPREEWKRTGLTFVAVLAAGALPFVIADPGAFYDGLYRLTMGLEDFELDDTVKGMDDVHFLVVPDDSASPPEGNARAFQGAHTGTFTSAPQTEAGNHDLVRANGQLVATWIADVMAGRIKAKEVQ